MDTQTSGRPGPLVLMYHRVGRPGRRSPVNGQYVSGRAFAAHLALLRWSRRRVVPLEAVARHVRGEETLCGRDVAITFDDGFGNLYDNAYPALRRHDYPSTIFVITGYVGKTNTYHPPGEDLYEPLLSADQILEMQADGVTFGSHTRHHARLVDCDPARLEEEIAGSKTDLELLLKRPVYSFCYPYGAQDERVRQAAIEAGYDYACSTLKGRNDRGTDPYRLRRINIRADTTLPTFLYKLARARYANV